MTDQRMDEDVEELPEYAVRSPAAGPADLAKSPDPPTCGLEPVGPCGESFCGPLMPTLRWRLPRLRIPHCRFPIWCGPLLHRGEEPGLLEEELRPPHARFHPVPTQPVFEPRSEYLPPQLMMTEAEKQRMFRQPLPMSPPDELKPLRD